MVKLIDLGDVIGKIVDDGVDFSDLYFITPSFNAEEAGYFEPAHSIRIVGTGHLKTLQIALNDFFRIREGEEK